MAFIWRKPSSGKWYIDYTPPGGKRTRKMIGKSKQAAQLALKEMEYKLSFQRAGIADPNITLGEFLADFERTMVGSLRPSSAKKYREVIQHFRAYLGPRSDTARLSSITQRMIEEYKTWRREGNSGFKHKANNGGSGPKAKTVNTELDVLGTIFNKAIEWNLLTESPVVRVARLKEDDSKPFRYFTLDEIKVLRLVADGWDSGRSDEDISHEVDAFFTEHPDLSPWIEDADPDEGRDNSVSRRKGTGRLRLPNMRALVDFCLGTGARHDEVHEVEWSWIDLRRRAVEFQPCDVWRPGSKRVKWVPKGTPGQVRFSTSLSDQLRKIKRSRGCPKIFLDGSGKPIPERTLERHIARLVGAARLRPATMHAFRHTFASHLAMAGVPLPTIQRLMRHKNIQTVMIYAHLCERHVDEATGHLPY